MIAKWPLDPHWVIYDLWVIWGIYITFMEIQSNATRTWFQVPELQ